MSNDENKFQPIFQILHIKSAWFLLELAMALVTTFVMRFLQVCPGFFYDGIKIGISANPIGRFIMGKTEK